MSDTIKALTETVRGRVTTASDRDCDTARAVCNAMNVRRPHAVIRCTDPADVMAVFAAARDGGADLAIRGGGHSVLGSRTVGGRFWLSTAKAIHDPGSPSNVNQNIAPAKGR